ncbi:hypothetical protein ABL78_2508 [Leptomonas seymouri]|uniref:Uncharacterized protein n=1 Tax=Leptomonas seymouri TaxID=5684 RepID=A0A0N0P752_LEPSE|nr:hypothetical protein ABL78_2508 [Leptomonas seymouri]|eukprot:KPI88389.1 hypothetical protein ABL78_2508 [Leptomonas seymouri]
MFGFLKGSKRQPAHSRSAPPSTASTSPQAGGEGDDRSSRVGGSSISQPPQLKDQGDSAQRAAREFSARSSALHRQVQTQLSAAVSRRDSRTEEDDNLHNTTQRGGCRSRRRRRLGCQNGRHHVAGGEGVPTGETPTLIETVSYPEKGAEPRPQRLSPAGSRMPRHTSKRRGESAEQLLARYPPRGTSAATAAAVAEEDRREREASIIPRHTYKSEVAGPPQNAANAASLCRAPLSPRPTLAVTHSNQKKNAGSDAQQQQQQQEAPPATFAVARVLPSSQRPPHLANDVLFMQYLRQVSPTSDGHRCSPPRYRSSPSNVLSSPNGVRAGTAPPAEGGETERDRADGRTGLPRSRCGHALNPAAAFSHSKALPPTAGSVTFSSSSSSDTNAEERRPLRRLAPSSPLVDARKVFKVSPDRIRPGGQQKRAYPSPNQRRMSPWHSTMEGASAEEGEREMRRRSDARPVTEEAQLATSSETATQSAHRSESEGVKSDGSRGNSVSESGSDNSRVSSPTQRMRPSTSTPPALPPSQPQRHSSRRQQRAYASSRHTRASFASDSEVEDQPALSPARQPRSHPKSLPSHLSTSARRGDETSTKQQQVEEPLDSSSDPNDDDQHTPVSAKAKSLDGFHLHVVPSSLSPPLDEEENAWTFTDMSTNVTSHRLHLRRREHTPPPAPSPVGTRRLLTAWVSYLQKHGQPHMYGYEADDVAANGQTQFRRGSTIKDLSTCKVPAEVHSNAQKGEGAVVVPPDVRVDGNDDGHPTAAAAATRRDRLRACEKEVLLLRASLLMTYTLLAAGGKKTTVQWLASSAAARRWKREMGRHTGWTETAEQREQQQGAKEGRGGANAEQEKGGSDDGNLIAQHRKSGQQEQPDPSYLHSATLWPALEARLAASVRAAAQDLADSSSLTHGSAQRQSTPVNEPSKHGAATGLPSPRLLLRETPSHDLKGLPSLWYPPHLSDAVGPVSGVLSVWFSGADEDGSGDSSVEEEKDDAGGSSGHVPVTSTLDSVTREDSTHTAHPHPQSHSSCFLAFSRRPSSKRGKSSAAAMKGAWRRCFVVADDRGVRAYPTERDYTDYASERLLMAVPYTSLAYLLPDFDEAAAAVNENRIVDVSHRGTASPSPSLSAAQAYTIAAIGSCIDAHSGSSYVHFGFLHRQTSAAEQRVAASAAAAGTSLLRALRGQGGPSLHFASWGMSRHKKSKGGLLSASSLRSAQHLHPPLVFRTQSRLAHAEWVHYFAYKFNRHLYELLFPTTCASMAGVGLRSKAAQADIREGNTPPPPARESATALSPKEMDGPAEQRQSQRRRQHRSHDGGNTFEKDDDDKPYESDQAEDERGFCGKRAPRRSRACRHRRNASTSDGEDDNGEHKRPEASSSLSSPSCPSEPPSPPDVSNQFARVLQHTRPLTPAALDAPASTREHREQSRRDAEEDRSSLTEAVAQLRRTLELRDEQLRNLEAEQTALTKSLRQREQQVQALQQDQIQLRDELKEASESQQRLRRMADGQREEIQRLRTATGAAVPSAAPHELAGTVLAMEAAHKRELALLQDQLEYLQRGYTADQAAWRAEQRALETRCRAMEAQVENSKRSASHDIHSFARQVVRDLDDFHDEATQGARKCVSSMLSHRPKPRQLHAPPNLCSDDDSNTPQRSPRAGTVTALATAGARAIASLLLTFEKGVGYLVDGELTVDEAEARLLYSRPTANQRGRRWELRHHETDALLRIQLELLSRAPGDPQTSPVLRGPPSLHRRSHSCTEISITRRSSRSRPPPPPSPPLHTLSPGRLHRPFKLEGGSLSSLRHAERCIAAPTPSPPPAPDLLKEDPKASGHDGPARRGASTALVAYTPLSSALRAVDVLPRDTRASRLRQAAIERQIQEREALSDA